MSEIIDVPTIQIPREANIEPIYPMEARFPPIRVIVHEDKTLKGLGYVEFLFSESPFSQASVIGAAMALGQLAALKWPKDDCKGWFMDDVPFVGYSRMVNGERSYVHFILTDPRAGDSEMPNQGVYN